MIAKLTEVVMFGEWQDVYMKGKGKKVKAKSIKAESNASTVRATITFPTELHATLEEIAKKKKVSLAWVVREAAEQYLTEKWPLFRAQA